MTAHRPPLNSVLKFVGYFAKQQSLLFSSQALLCFVWSVKETLLPFLLKLIIDKFATQQSPTTNELLTPFVMIMIIWCMMEFAMRIQGFMSIKSFAVFRSQIRRYCFMLFNQQRYQWLNQYEINRLASCSTQLPHSCQTVLEILLLHFCSIFGALTISVILLATAHLVFGALLVTWLILHLSITYFFNPKLATSGLAHAKSNANLDAAMTDVLTNNLNVKWFNRFRFELSRFNQLQQTELMHSNRQQTQVESMRISQSLLAILYMGAMLVFTANYWHQHLLSPGDLALIPLLSFSALGMIWWLTQEINLLYRHLNQIRANLQLLANAEDVTVTASEAVKLPKMITINCNQVSFAYGDETLIHNLSLTIEANTKLGIMGLSGAGKTTLLKLLTGIIQPTSGMITLGGYPISSIPASQLGSMMAVVPQDVTLFHRSILENIQYGRLSATTEQMITVAKQAQCHDFIMQQPNGYQTIVGDRGERLSHGQRQRILIARALLSDASILILDEPTASLDEATETRLLASLQQVCVDKTLIIISHRQSLLRLVNQIVYFERGYLTSNNSHETIGAAV